MPVYRVQAPDGSILRIQGPENADPAQLAAAAEQYHKSQPSAPAAPAAPAPNPYSSTGGFWNNAAAGAGREVDRVLDGLTQAYLHQTSTPSASAALQNTIDEKRGLDKPLMATTGGKLGEIAGDVGMTYLPAGAVARGVGLASKAPALARTMMALGGNAATNAAYDATKATASDETTGGNASEGAVDAVLGTIFGKALGKGIKGVVSYGKEAMQLPEAVRLKATLGQLVDKNSTMGRFVNGVEEKLQSTPIIGDIIGRARQGGVDAWRNNVLGKVVPDGYTPSGDNMRQVIDGIQGEFDRRYRGALANETIGPSQQFEHDVLAAVSDPKRGLTPEQANTVRGQIMRYYQSMFHAQPTPTGMPAGTALALPGQAATPIGATGDQAKSFESFLSSQARQHRMSNAPQSQDFASLYGDLEDAWSKAYRGQLSPQAAAALAPLDTKYAPFKTLERATTAIGNDQGAFTPNQLLTAVKARTPGSEFAAGQGMLEHDADIGKSVFQPTLANSGTADRALLATLGYGALTNPVGTAAKLGTGAAIAIPTLTTQAGKNAMTGNTALQLMLQRMRAPQALDQAGVPIGQALDDTWEQ